MAFRRSFDCLWCGQAWEVRSDDDLEGWAVLCPECLGKADTNGFLRGRLRTALRERAAAASPAAASPAVAATGATPAHDDWYLRRGRFSRGPLYDGPWQMELDQATRWLDDVPMTGVLVELGCGSGWWSALLASKGELWLYDGDGPSLDAARARLVAHGLLAHLHQRDPLAAPDKAVDVVFAALLLSAAADQGDLDARLTLAMGWLKPGGTFVFIEPSAPGGNEPSAPGGNVPLAGGDAPLDGPAGPLWPRESKGLRDSLLGVGFASVEIGGTRSAFVLGTARTAT
jgi:SAM-dependent methyltransferase